MTSFTNQQDEPHPHVNGFEVILRVRYAECDAQGVVFNARYGDYVDLVATEFYRTAFGSYQNMLSQDVDTQVVSLKTDWSAPARFDDVLLCRLRVASVGNTSFSLQVDFSNYLTGQAIAQATIVYVTVSPSDYTKKSLPEFVRNALESVPATTVNLAGVL